MGGIIVMFLAAILGFFVACKIDDAYIFFPVLFALAGAIFINVPITHIFDEATYDNYTTPISIINDSASVEGHFVLGSGSVEGKNVYKYYEPQSNGSDLLKQIDADGVQVFQDSDTPYLTHLGHCTGPRDWFWPCNDQGYGRTIEIHVPKGSMQTSSTLDAN